MDWVWLLFSGGLILLLCSEFLSGAVFYKLL